jgi:glucose/mannose-6-phosphate isomerase
MEQYCIKHKIEYRNIPYFHSPRASFTGFLYSILRVLGPILPVKHNDVKDSILELKKIQKRISSDHLNEKNPSLNLAEWIKGIPLIYYPFGLQAAAIRFKNSLQENTKIHAMAEDVLEASHNGIVAWEKRSSVQPILLEGQDDYIKTKERWTILKEYFNENKIDYWKISSVKGNILSKLINMIYLLDYSTIYRAVLSKVDPSPINSIDYIKDRLYTKL